VARSRLITTAAVIAAALSLAAVPALGAVKVRSEEGAILARYKKLDCKVSKRGGFHADHAAVNGWKFRAVVYGGVFDGFHRYKLKYGKQSDADFSVFNRRRSFSNQFVPETDIPRLVVGGSIQFPKGRKVFRMGFPIAYDGNGPHPNLVSVVGQAPCRY
jgi:hypothetical protein